MLNGLDLFSGIGGLSLALEPWIRVRAYCEIDRYCQAVLLSQISRGCLSMAPIWDDVRTLQSGFLPSMDIITGGFPCQDLSAAGLGAGLDGERSGLFWQLHRLVKETNPRFVFLENVPAIRTRGLEIIVQAFTELGFNCRWTVVSAQEIGAPHRRARWFFLAANANSEALRIEQRRLEGQSGRATTFHSSNGDKRAIAQSSERPFEPRVSRAGDGLPFAVDRDRGLGNSVVPAQARKAFAKLMGLEERN